MFLFEITPGLIICSELKKVRKWKLQTGKNCKRQKVKRSLINIKDNVLLLQ